MAVALKGWVSYPLRILFKNFKNQKTFFKSVTAIENYYFSHKTSCISDLILCTYFNPRRFATVQREIEMGLVIPWKNVAKEWSSNGNLR